MPIHDDVPRRRFLAMAAGAAAVGACSSSSQTIGDVPAFNVSTLPVGSLEAVGTQPVCIGRDANGVYALSLYCTHMQCNIATQGTVSPQGIHCGCHGSSFDVNGNVTQGPAAQALTHFAVTKDASGNLTIHGMQTVSANTRLAV
jgi:Rieske Fe-S protein